MGKIIFKMLLMTAVFVGIGNYMLYITTGQSPFSNFKLPTFSSAKQDLKSGINNTFSSGKQEAYKWTDKNGVVHYSSAPPEHLATQTQIDQATHNKQLQKIEVDPNTNLIQGVKLAEKKEEQITEKPAATTNVYSPAGAQKLLNDAKNVEKLLNDRFEAQKKAIDSH